jgi:hypothetical protein
MFPVDGKPARVVPSPIINSRRNVMLHRVLIAVVTIGAPAAANVPVYVKGETSTNTGANGNLSVAGVTRPYGITVVDSTNKRALVSQGPSRQDPTLTFFSSTPGTVTSSLSPSVSSDGRAELTGFQNSTIINCAGGSIC